MLPDEGRCCSYTIEGQHFLINLNLPPLSAVCSDQGVYFSEPDVQNRSRNLLCTRPFKKILVQSLLWPPSPDWNNTKGQSNYCFIPFWSRKPIICWQIYQPSVDWTKQSSHFSPVCLFIVGSSDCFCRFDSNTSPLLSESKLLSRLCEKLVGFW